MSTLLAEGGPVMPLILLAALAGYVLACERLLVWGAWWFRDRPLRRFLESAEGSLTAWLEAAAANGTPAATPLGDLLRRVLALRALPEPRREAELEALLLARLPRMDTRISTIGWLGSILPLLGLLGTVSGMITTFQDLSVTTSRQVLSQGLSEALWTTEIGLIGAVPLLAAHHLLSRLRARWLNALERCLALLQAEARS